MYCIYPRFGGESRFFGGEASLLWHEQYLTEVPECIPHYSGRNFDFGETGLSARRSSIAAGAAARRSRKKKRERRRMQWRPAKPSQANEASKQEAASADLAS